MTVKPVPNVSPNTRAKTTSAGWDRVPVLPDDQDSVPELLLPTLILPASRAVSPFHSMMSSWAPNMVPSNVTVTTVWPPEQPMSDQISASMSEALVLLPSALVNVSAAPVSVMPLTVRKAPAALLTSTMMESAAPPAVGFVNVAETVLPTVAVPDACWTKPINGPARGWGGGWQAWSPLPDQPVSGKGQECG